MWDVFERVFSKKNKIKEIGSYIHQEVVLLSKLRKIHQKKVEAFNSLLLEIHSKGDVNKKFLVLRKYVLLGDLFKGAKQEKKITTRLEVACKRVLARKSNSAEITKLLGELNRVLEGIEAEQLVKSIYSQIALIKQGEENFLEHIDLFKHLLDEEAHALQFDYAVMTEVEEKLKHLHSIDLEAAKFGQERVVAWIKSILVNLGYKKFKVKINGSTARKTNLKDSDIDVVIFIPGVQRTELDIIYSKLKSDKTITIAYPEIKKIFMSRKYPKKGLRLFSGNIHYSSGLIVPIHLVFTEDLNIFQEILYFQIKEASKIKKLGEKRVKIFQKEVKTLKKCLKSARLYGVRDRNYFSGTSIEKVLRQVRLKRFFQDIASLNEAWNEGIIAKLVLILKKYGLDNEDIVRFLGEKGSNLTVDSQRNRAQMLIVTATRYLLKKRITITINDFKKFYPGLFVAEVPIAYTQYAQKFIVETQRILGKNKPILGTQLVLTPDDKWTIYLAIANKGGEMKIKREIKLNKIDQINLGNNKLVDAAFIRKTDAITISKNRIFQFWERLIGS